MIVLNIVALRAVLVGVFLWSAFAMSAWAADDRPAVVFDLGGKFDRSFNEGVYLGVERFTKETHIPYAGFEISNEAQREQTLRKFADDGYSPIVAAGFAQASALVKVAKDYPDTKFIIIDSVVEAPNVQSLIFKDEEGSYLVGVLAALASKTGKVGFVGGMDIPLIRQFSCGYRQGAKAVNANIIVYETMVGDTGSAWNDPVKGGEIAKSLIAKGADVIYHAAGGTGIGVLQAAVEGGILGIGVDANQNGLYPGKILTSMLKRVDVVTNKILQEAKDGRFHAGITRLGLAQNGVDYAMDDNNKGLVTEMMQKKVEAAKAAIVDGQIVVHDYISTLSCPIN